MRPYLSKLALACHPHCQTETRPAECMKHLCPIRLDNNLLDRYLARHLVIQSKNLNNMTSTNSDSSRSNRPKLKCSICGKEFENVGDMQRHTTVEHMQKGEIPSGSKDA